MFNYFVLLLCSANIANSFNFSSNNVQPSLTSTRQTSGLPNTKTIFVCIVVPEATEYEHNQFDYTMDYSTYKAILNYSLTSLRDEMNKKYNSQLNLQVSSRGCDRRCKCHDAVYSCVKRHEQLVNDKIVKSGVILGPPCNAVDMEIHERLLKAYVSNIANGTDLTIISSTKTLLGRVGISKFLNLENEPGLFEDKLPPTLMRLDGSLHRDGLALAHLFAKYFEYRNVLLMSYRGYPSDQNRYCMDLLYFMKKQIMQIYSDLIFMLDGFAYSRFNNDLANSPINSTMWSFDKNFTRICLLCGNVRGVVGFLREVYADQKESNNEYGIFVILQEESFLDLYLNEMSNSFVNLSSMVEYVKFFIPRKIPCAIKPVGLQSFTDHPIRNTSECTEEMLNLQGGIGRMLCAMRHYLENATVASASDRLASAFAQTYRNDWTKISARFGAAMEWAPEYHLVSCNTTSKQSCENVLKVYYLKNNNKLEHVVEKLKPLRWYGKDKRLLDAPYLCKNVSRFFPCPLNGISDLSTQQKVIIAISICFSVVLLAVVITCVLCYIRRSDRYLRKRYCKQLEDWVRKKANSPRKILYGMFNKEKHIFLLINDQVDLKANNQLVPSWVLRDIHLLSTVSSSYSLTLLHLIGYMQHDNTMRLIYHFGIGLSLKDALKRVRLTPDMKYAICLDLATALSNIHNSPLKVHGNLRSSYCMLNNRFTVRVMLTVLPSANIRRQEDFTIQSATLLWTAPEILRNFDLRRSQSADIYSMGIIFQEIAYQRGPFYNDEIQGRKHFQQHAEKSYKFPEKLDTVSETSSLHRDDESCAEAIIEKVIGHEQIRPSLLKIKEDNKNTMENLTGLEIAMQQCWNEAPEKRPAAGEVYSSLTNFMKENKIDPGVNIAAKLCEISKQMMKSLVASSKELITERDRGVKYLMHMMPSNFAYDFMITENVKSSPVLCQGVSVYFNDLYELPLTDSNPEEALAILNELFKIYDITVKLYNVMPLHRVGTSLLLASGVPHSIDHHAYETALAALHIQQLVKMYDRMPLRLKAGIHSGEVMCGMVGSQIPQFGLFGDTVNTASRMQSTSEPDEIQISQSTRDQLLANKAIVISKGTERPIKGKGTMTTYILLGLKDAKKEDLHENRLDGHVPQGMASRFGSVSDSERIPLKNLQISRSNISTSSRATVTTTRARRSSEKF